MSIRLIITRGYGNGTFSGTIKDLVTRGYGISTIIPPTIPPSNGLVSNQSLGNGIASNQSLGNGILGTQSTGGGITRSGSL